jgi:hypothetical protein
MLTFPMTENIHATVIIEEWKTVRHSAMSFPSFPFEMVENKIYYND